MTWHNPAQYGKHLHNEVFACHFESRSLIMVVQANRPKPAMCFICFVPQGMFSGGFMKLIVVVLSLLLASSGWAGEKEYRRGSRVCTDLSEVFFKEDSENLYNQYAHASCLVIKGQDALGMPMIYHLADHESHIPSSYFIGRYLHSDGQFNEHTTRTNIDETLKYYFRTLALIDLHPNYGIEFNLYEAIFQVELYSVLYIPDLYLFKYAIGIESETCEKAIQHGYQESCPILSEEYQRTTLDNLNQALRFAQECAGLPEKGHFKPKLYQAIMKSCAVMVEVVLDIIPLEEKRQQLLLREDCKDPIECSEYMDNYTQISNLYLQSQERIRKSFERS